MRAVYATVEQVMRAPDTKAAAYLQDELLAALESGSDAVDALVSLGDEQRPAFAPWTGTIAFDWPTTNNMNSYRFWLNQFRLSSLSAIVSGGVDVSAIALPWPASGAPYSAIDINTDGPNSLDIGDGTGQRSLTITGTWGTIGHDDTRSTWTLASAIGSSADTAIVNAPIGTGSILLVDDERLLVTDRSWADSGQTASALTASMAAQAITVANGAAFLRGEDIMVESERMQVRAIAGNVLTVQRADSGSTLAAHSAGAPIMWARAATVQRGALGTTAASHGNGAQVSIYRPPALAGQLALAYAIDRRAQEDVAYARGIDIRDRRGLGNANMGGAVGGTGLVDLERRMIARYGRLRHRAI